MMDDREILLGELMDAAVTAFGERRFDDVDAIIDRAGEDRAQLLDMVEVALSLRGPVAASPQQLEELALSPMFDVRAWPEILEQARLAAGIKRPSLIEQLAARLGIGDADGRERLEERYHELETGQLSPNRVQPALIDALGELLGGIRETLAATRLNPLPDLGPAIALNRSAGEVLEMNALYVEPESMTDSQRRVDDLFGV